MHYNKLWLRLFMAAFLIGSYMCTAEFAFAQLVNLKKGFLNPPASAKPGVYWYFMDGNMTAASITKDLEAMKKAGIGNLIFLEVNVGIPRGKVDFLSDEWQELFKHAVKESERLGIEITLGIGPGWTGSGGPWVPANQSMQHLVSSAINIQGGSDQKITLPIPAPMKPYFGEGAFTPELKKQWNDFYEDVAVLAYPTPTANKKIEDIDEKALYYRAPYSSVKDVKQYLPSLPVYEQLPPEAIIHKNKIIDLTNKLQKDGTLSWKVPPGNWTIVRFGKRNNGAITRPAPVPGLGFESDKFDTVALNAHLDNYVGRLIRKTGKPDSKKAGGLKRLHMDSWEMGSQNWTSHFRAEFIKRRGYDPLPFYPVYAGNVVESLEISERFLWDLRQTSQELVLEYHAGQVKKYGHRNGLGLSIEPYDMNPTADLELGNIADVPMAEFWSKGLGFNSSFSCFEATSIAHVNGKSLVPAETFTAQDNEGWKQYPGSMKNQGDWAFANGINRFTFHTFQNQVLADSLRPGMTMGPYGVHWDRNQTWWPMVGAYHEYVSRCSYLLQQGNTVADVLYLTPEGSPHVFRPPFSAIDGDVVIPDRKGYNFDGCAPGQLYKAIVKNGRIVFPGGASYRIMVLPAVKTMTPDLLQKIGQLVKDGAVVVGAPPVKSPGLSGYPACDNKVIALAKAIWGANLQTDKQTTHAYGKGKVIWGGELEEQIDNLYPKYELTAALLKAMDVKPDFETDGQLRYTHRTSADWDIYFVSNRTDGSLKTNAIFRSTKGAPQLWNAITGEIRNLPEYKVNGTQTTIPMQFDAYESFFVVFAKRNIVPKSTQQNFPMVNATSTLDGPWEVSFDPKWGGPANIAFDKLQDWTQRTEEGIKYYSGTAVYKKEFDLPENVSLGKTSIYLDLGEVHDMARVKLNGKDLGIVWTAPWRVNIASAGLQKHNKLEIEVINRWPNRLTGDSKYPDDGIKDETWPEWIVKGLPRHSKRLTFATYNFYDEKSPLLKSGLVGPVTIQYSKR
ncbi:glycosyl hydrolase [Mucilaginibacter sp. BJC16-A38]|uniref:glycosyl hydrolase n=1 Tax=Mucilaginibacter phenanthrenivorans TaxID=1234842 RepID=UPI002157E692|nr:glycosyl hydrolase [Mucilaginibacter phenanthrenivorans]MCR8560239.1 glycosyl hydrolase [Mucilaginibacter phenanthrenivorans]